MMRDGWTKIQDCAAGFFFTSHGLKSLDGVAFVGFGETSKKRLIRSKRYVAQNKAMENGIVVYILIL